MRGKSLFKDLFKEKKEVLKSEMAKIVSRFLL